MIVEKPFCIGYTLNLASWRSWIALLVAGGLLYQERSGDEGTSVSVDDDASDDPVEVVVEE